LIDEADPRIVADNLDERTINQHRQRQIKIAENKRTQREQKLREAAEKLEKERV
jgi:hypothetical protein